VALYYRQAYDHQHGSNVTQSLGASAKESIDFTRPDQLLNLRDRFVNLFVLLVEIHWEIGNNIIQLLFLNFNLID